MKKVFNFIMYGVFLLIPSTFYLFITDPIAKAILSKELYSKFDSKWAWIIIHVAIYIVSIIGFIVWMNYEN